ncbi:putative RING-H2 finger protein ATL36 [Salvia miltiorrhiza]|uniref:putative RING-H2 finger protein ATL36 n=1 Tax=Salvia miltiorrhiza TaxID=226208 RepID=UPI0025AD5DF3|nr:putative RING-H2 finger protein ATL36 [Salvia miltiorrhiza]
MMSSGINLVMTVIGFTVSTMFIVFVCTRLICARIQLNASRRSFARSDFSVLERGLNGIEPLVVANFPTRKYRDLCLTSKENAQCSICLSDYHGEDSLRFLPLCGHSFHAACIDIWLQQHSTCPVCRVSLRELPEKKWFMQPMFSSAIRSQYSAQPPVNAHYCHCMANGPRPSSLSHSNLSTHHHHPVQPDEAAVRFGESKESGNRKGGTPSER